MAQATSYGRFEVVEELGAGASGVVYLCVDPDRSLPVAVKVLRPPPGASAAAREEYLARFRRETEAASSLDHPGLVHVYEVGPDWYVMEYLEGRTLAQRLQDDGPLPAALVLSLVDSVAQALDYAHGRGIVHRDVKPANLMLEEDGHARVMDFGVARVDASHITSAGAVVGSVRYMSPEQMLGQAVDRRSDVFSLGVVAYEALTGHAPFGGRTVTELVANVVHGRHVPPCTVDTRLAPSVDTVFARVFAVDPAERYGTTLEFARALEEALVSATRAGGELASDTTLVVAPTDTVTESVEALPEAEALLPRAVRPERDRSEAGVAFEVDSRPSGAAVEVDGRLAGATKLSLRLAPGRHVLRFSRPGHRPVEQELDVDPGALPRLLSVVLPKGDDATSPVAPPGPDVIPPRRVSGRDPVYPAAAARDRLVGAPVVEVLVTHTGEVATISIVESAGPVLDQALVRAVTRWRFEPGTRDGAPVSTRLTVQHVFR